MGVDCGRGGVLPEADLEGVRSVGDAAEADLLPDTDGVVLARQVVTSSKVVALDGSRSSSEPLGAARPRPPPHVALQLTDADVEVWSPRGPEELESVAALGRLQDHVLARVITADHGVGLLARGGREGGCVAHSVLVC